MTKIFFFLCFCSVYGCPVAKKRKSLDRQSVESSPKRSSYLDDMDNSTMEECYDTDGTEEMDEREEEEEGALEEGEVEEGYMDYNEPEEPEERGEHEEEEEEEVEQEDEEEHVEEEEDEDAVEEVDYDDEEEGEHSQERGETIFFEFKPISYEWSYNL